MTKRTPGPEPFNNPFSKVKIDGSKAKAAPAAPVVKEHKPIAEDAEAAMFLEAMGEVAPVKAGKKPPVEPARRDPIAVASEEAESLAQLAELVVGDELVVSGSEGALRGLDPEVMRRLRAGQFVARAELDCRGLPTEKGRAGLEEFLRSARRESRRCVRVQGVALSWLTGPRSARHVLAFCTLAPGVALVLLRR